MNQMQGGFFIVANYGIRTILRSSNSLWNGELSGRSVARSLPFCKGRDMRGGRL